MSSFLYYVCWILPAVILVAVGAFVIGFLVGRQLWKPARRQAMAFQAEPSVTLQSPEGGHSRV